MNQTLQLTVKSPEPRLDRFISGKASLSRSYARKLIDDGNVTIDGRPGKASLKLDPGDIVTVILPPPAPTSPEPEDLPLKIVYEDADLLVIDKPAGLTVHPAPGHPSGTLVNAVLAHVPDLPGINGSLRPGIVHRLDKDTSGLIVVAKTDAAEKSLSQQIRGRTATKVYLALVEGKLSPEEGVIEAPIGRDPAHRKQMAVTAGGRESRTRYRVLRHLNSHTYVEVVLETGRTHQIRVHFAAIGYPVLGDAVYGTASPLLKRQFLHAHRLGFKLPGSGRYVEFESSLPPDLQTVLDELSVDTHPSR